MSLRIPLLICLLVSPFASIGQKAGARPAQMGSAGISMVTPQEKPVSKVEFEVANPQVKKYITMMDSVDAKSMRTEGYRIQVFSASGPNAKATAFERQSEFLQLYNATPSHTKWNYPNWVLRVGDFRTRLEAVEFHEVIKAKYPASFIIKDEIEVKY